jgi:hypothetical protein
MVYKVISEKSINTKDEVYDMSDLIHSSKELLDLNYNYYTTDLSNNSITWDIDEKMYQEVTSNTKAYIGINKSGDLLEDNENFFFMDNLYDDNYMQLVNSDDEYKVFDEEVEEILGENSFDFSWDQRLLSSYSYWCDECSEEEIKKFEAMNPVYMLRPSLKYKGEEVLNAGYLIKLQKEGDLYRGVISSTGEIYEDDDIKEYLVSIIDYNELLSLKGEQRICVLTHNFYDSDNISNEEVVITDIKRYLFPVNYLDSNKTALLPVFVIFGKQGDKPVYGILNLIDYDNTFKTMTIDENLEDEKIEIIDDPIMSITYEKNIYYVTGTLSKYQVLTDQGIGIYDIVEAQVENFYVDVIFPEGQWGSDVRYDYEDELINKLENIKTFEYDYENNTFELSFSAQDFWYVYWTNGLSKKARLTTDNKIKLNICIELKYKKLFNTETREFCEVGTYEVPLPDFL